MSIWTVPTNFRAIAIAAVRVQLIMRHLPLARRIALGLFQRRSHNAVALDDYLQYAQVGLLEAIDRYDQAQGVPFERFAMQRIRGAILNGLATTTELAARYKESKRLAHTLTTTPVQTTTAAQLQGWVDKVMGLAVGLLLERAAQFACDDGVAASPYASVALMELQQQVVAAVDALPTREAWVIRQHYFEQQAFHVIAEKLGVSKGRVSQLHVKALSRLRVALRASVCDAVI